MADPHTKCYLLIQAHITHSQLPISDYITDTRTVMDQLPRLLAAMQFVSLDDRSAMGSFDLLCSFAKVRQVLHTRSMPNSDPLTQIPGLSQDGPRRLESRGVSAFWDLLSLPRDDVQSKLGGLLTGGGRRGGRSSGGGGGRVAYVFLDGMLTVEVEKVFVRCEVEKASGKSMGVLTLELSIRRRGGQNKGDQKRRGGRDRSKDDAPSNIVLALGTFQNRLLLSYKSVAAMTGGGDAATRKVEMTFDWSLANANGG
eukprot:CAMPEP_0183294532 /NCGR_PEP_ID=MMETSP0160_2-20130417/2840_1 /TAXON_ID=2839 ORGANISM="Odontella Sinensis, Strain Grunow 1884" /NCGR_SAMPLE_ID=MMETSP0160_2 /ASSEMBLY_ACC=CAM_ASM_000250 /LENGTH=254 /DNA_ID=CAMNT_0025455877 /DNA_START=14 /DNA_END=774 /DNA_ORIENTATION=+